MNENVTLDDSDATVFGFDEDTWSLRGVSGEQFGKTFKIEHAMLIGRHADCDLVLNTSKISRRHAQIRRTGLALHLEDLDSSNGTFVNNQQITSTKLKNGDQIQFGTTERFMIVLEVDGKAVQPETAVEDQEVLEELQEERGSVLPWVVGGGLVIVLIAAAVWWFL